MVQSGGNGNFLSNLHLVGGSVGVNQCKSDDNSWYCQLSRGYSALIMVISIVAICGVLYYLAKTFLFSDSHGRDYEPSRGGGCGKKYQSKSK